MRQVPFVDLKAQAHELHDSAFDETWTGERADAVRAQVAGCERRCWMTVTAVPAMKRHLPSVVWWVARNNVRVALGKPVDLGD